MNIDALLCSIVANDTRTWLLIELYAAQSAARDNQLDMVSRHWDNAMDHATEHQRSRDTCEAIPQLLTPQRTLWTVEVFNRINDIACRDPSVGLTCYN